MPRRINMDEVVEDSEPEREERRHQEKQERKESLQRPVATNREIAPSILELCDNDVLYVMPSKTTQAPIGNEKLENGSVIDISDDDVPPARFPNKSKDTGIPTISLYFQVPVLVVETATTSPKRAPSVPTMSFAPAVSSDSESDFVDDNRLKLNHFAYLNPSRSQSKVPTSRATSVSAIDKAVPKPLTKKKPTHSTAPHRFAADFTEAELARLAKCVSCDVRWTIRKGVTPKMVHLQSCAKKNGLTDDTVKVLIRQEVQRSIAEDPTSNIKPAGKGKGKADELENSVLEAPKTYLEVIQAETKRKGRRPETVETVKTVTENRNDILDRARTVLGNHVLPNTQEAVDRQQTQGFGTSRLVARLGRNVGNRDGPPATQPFGQSALGQRQGSGLVFGGAVRKDSVFGHGYSDDEEVDAPPTTQGFAPSRLGGLHPGSTNSISHMHHNKPSDPPSPGLHRTSPAKRSPIVQSSALASSSIIDLVSSSSRDPSPQSRRSDGYAEARPPVLSHLQTSLPLSALSLNLPGCSGEGSNGPSNMQEVHNEHKRQQYEFEDERPRDDNDAFLHFDPDLENHHLCITEDQAICPELSDTGYASTYIKPTSAKKRRKSKTRRALSEQSDASSGSSSIKKSTKGKDKQRAVRDIDPPLDDEWEHEMKTQILGDLPLHLRILRYEPIHFDVFLQKATASERPSGRLRHVLRAFLDKQAINFYGAEPSKRGRR